MKRVVLIAVHYRNAVDIETFAANVDALKVPPGWSVDLVVVDNSGGAPSVSGASLVIAPGNLGYLGGAAFGLEQWQLQHPGEAAEWVGIINPDIALDRDAVEVLAAAGLSSDVVAVAPSVLLRGTTPQNPFLARRPSRLRMWLYTIVFRSLLLTKILDGLLAVKRRQARGRETDRPGPVYAAHGSAFFLRRPFFDRGGTLRYRAFMYGEEIHVAEQVRSMKGLIWFLPQIRAIHRGSSTTSAAGSALRRVWHLDSARVLWEDYFR
jgi:GT2 family glycosyltransferase